MTMAVIKSNQLSNLKYIYTRLEIFLTRNWAQRNQQMGCAKGIRDRMPDVCNMRAVMEI